MKVMTILGTRPEIIRLSRVMAALDRHTEHVLVHTGQNYDYELNEMFFDELEVRKPDHFLGVDTTSLGSVLGGVIEQSETVMRTESPDAVLVLGDTNSCLAAIMAKRLGIPVFHMEAGNRCFDLNVPEEVNRRIIDHVADINLVYTEHARRNLLAEGLHPRHIYLTGSPLREVLTHYRPMIDAADPFSILEIEEDRYYLVSMHREENVDDPDRLRLLVGALESLGRDSGLPVIVSTHPRTAIRLTDLDVDFEGAGVRFLKPFGFHDYNALQLQARCVLSDSGSIAEESAILGFRAVTMRDSIERPEAMDTGSIMITGLKPVDIQRCVALAESSDPASLRSPHAYAIANTSERVVRLIVGTHSLLGGWTGRRQYR